VSRICRFNKLTANILWFSDAGHFDDNTIISFASAMSQAKQLLNALKQLITRVAASTAILKLHTITLNSASSRALSD